MQHKMEQTMGDQQLMEDIPPGVVYVYQDVLTCGACSKQFAEMMDFLTHKAEHAFGDTGLVKCELCKLLFSEKKDIISHYSDHHQVDPWNLNHEILPMQSESTYVEETSLEAVSELDDPHLSMIVAENGIIPDIPDAEMSTKCLPDANFSEEDEELTSPSHADLDHQVIKKETHIDIMAMPDSATGLLLVPACNGEAQIKTRLLCSQPDHEDSLNSQVLLNGPSLGDSVVQNGFSPEKTMVATDASKNHSHLTRAQVSGTRRSFKTNTIRAKIKSETATNASDLMTSSEVDFSFILQTEIKNGSHFSYGRSCMQCLHCTMRTSSKATLVKHMQEKHTDMLALHEHLEVKDSNVSDRKRVIRLSTYETMCAQSGSRWRGSGNRKGCDPLGVFPCDRCSKTFSRKRYLMKHMVSHRTERLHKCLECNKSFKSKTYLTMHMKVHRDKLFQCNQCDFSSHVNAAIHSHRQLHNQDSVLCDICGFAYGDRSTLKKHKRVHDMSRPFACTFLGCTWRFKSEVMCKAHIRAHTQQGKFKCASCGYCFRHKHHLQRHEKNMHGIQSKSPRAQTNRKETLVDFTGENFDIVISDEQELLAAAEEPAAHQLVVSTDATSDQLNLEDLSTLNLAYQTLLQAQDGCSQEAHTILMSQPTAQLVFKQV